MDVWTKSVRGGLLSLFYGFFGHLDLTPKKENDGRQIHLNEATQFEHIRHSTTVDFDTDDLDLDSKISSNSPSMVVKSLTELKSNTSYKSNASHKSNVSNKSQKKRKSRKPEELR